MKTSRILNYKVKNNSIVQEERLGFGKELLPSNDASHQLSAETKLHLMKLSASELLA